MALNTLFKTVNHNATHFKNPPGHSADNNDHDIITRKQHTHTPTIYDIEHRRHLEKHAI